MFDLKNYSDVDTLKFNLHKRALNEPATKFEWKNPEEADGVPIYARCKVSASDPNIKATFNNFAVIMNKKAGYLAGNIERHYADDVPESVIAKYKEFDRLNNTETLYTDLMASCCGWGNTYTLCYLDANKDVRCKEVQAWNCKVIYDDDGEPTKAYIYYHVNEDNDRLHIWEYDKTTVIEYRVSKTGNSIEVLEQTIHGFSEIPVVEWTNNKLRRGNAQNAVTLMDAYDRLMSDNITEWATFRQAYLLLKNCGRIDENTKAEMQKTGIFDILGDGEAKFITKDINPEFVKYITEKTWKSIWIVSASIDPEAIGSLTNATAFQIQQMYANMEADCKFTEQSWMKSFEYLDRILKSYWRGLDVRSVEDYSTYDIDYTFVRSTPKDVLTYLKDLKTAGGMLPNEEILKQAGYDEQTAQELSEQAQNEGIDYLPTV